MITRFKQHIDIPYSLHDMVVHMVRDSRGTYPKAEVLSNLISDANYLIQYGEYKIALENLLDNLAEYELKLDDQTLDLAICAFDNNISLRNKGALAALQKDDHE